MDLKYQKISSPQLMLLVLGFIMGSFLLTSFIDSLAKQDAWLVIIAAFAVSVPFVLSYIVLAKWFPDKSLIQMSDIIYGPFLGKAVSGLYVLYFFYWLSLNFMTFKQFYGSFVLPEMPAVFVMGVLAIVSAFSVYKGLETIARISLVAVVISLATVTITFLLLLGNMDLTNFLPVLEASPKNFFQSIHIFSSISFCEVVVFLMIFPAVNHETKKKAGKYALGGFAIAAVILLVTVVRNTAVLGPSTSILANASYDAARLINIGEVLTRIDLLIAISITIALFIKVSVYYYVSAQSIAQLFRMRSISTLLIPLGIIAVIIGMIAFDSSVDNYTNAIAYHPIYTLPFEFVIPPLSVFVAWVRKLHKQSGAKNASGAG